MPVERITCDRDRRPDRAGVSTAARLLAWKLQAGGIVLELTDDARLRVRPGQRVSVEDRRALTRHFHEIRDLLREEKLQ